MGGSLNQPCRVPEEGPTGCKRLLAGRNEGHAWPDAAYPPNKDRLTPCQQPR